MAPRGNRYNGKQTSAQQKLDFCNRAAQKDGTELPERCLRGVQAQALWPSGEEGTDRRFMDKRLSLGSSFRSFSSQRVPWFQLLKISFANLRQATIILHLLILEPDTKVLLSDASSETKDLWYRKNKKCKKESMKSQSPSTEIMRPPTNHFPSKPQWAITSHLCEWLRSKRQETSVGKRMWREGTPRALTVGTSIGRSSNN